MRNETLVSINETAFQKLQQESMLVIKFNGSIVQKNSSAEILFPLNNLFENFVGETKKEIYQFVEKLIKTQDVSHKKVFFNGKVLSFKGLVEEDFIFLSIVQHEIANHEAQKLVQVTRWSWDYLNIGVLGIDAQDQVIEFNAPVESYLQLEQQYQLIGKNYKDLLDGKPYLNLLVNMVEESSSKHEPIQRYYYDQEVFYQLLAFYYEEDQSVYLFINDNTYLQQFENLLLYKEQMEQVSQLAAGVAHEIRNPLSVIKGFIQLANHTKRFDQFYDTVISEIDRMNEIIEDFLAVSRKGSFKKSRYIPQKIISSLISIMQSECLLHGIDFEYTFDKEDQLFVDVNEGMIKQVLLNLLRNAIEAFNESEDNFNSKVINIAAYQKDGFYHIEFLDNGPGMDADILAHLGKPFFTTKEKGTGIGIPMCKKIIQDHGGNFTIDSTVGKGTVIKFTLPIVNN